MVFISRKFRFGFELDSSCYYNDIRNVSVGLGRFGEVIEEVVFC